jgi:acyl carrier protein
VDENDHIQEDLELDSIDGLNLVTALHKRLGIDIPEASYPQIATLCLAVVYFARARLKASS